MESFEEKFEIQDSLFNIRYSDAPHFFPLAHGTGRLKLLAKPQAAMDFCVEWNTIGKTEADQFSVFSFQFSVFSFRCSMFDVRCSMFDSPHPGPLPEGEGVQRAPLCGRLRAE